MLFIFPVSGGKLLKIEVLYYTYRRLMYKIAYKILNNKHDAKDAVSETFFKISKNLDRIHETDSPRTRNFLVIVCRNTAIDMYNKRSRDESCKYSDDTAECTAYDPEDMVIKTETLNRLTDIIKELDPKYRDVFLLRRAYKLSREEIADTLGLTVETVKKRLSRAKSMILEKYREEEL